MKILYGLFLFLMFLQLCRSMKRGRNLPIVLLCLLGLSARAQSNQPPTSIPSFVASAESYFTSFDTNSETFSTNSPYEMWTGAAYQNGINLGAQIGLEASPISKWPALTLGSVSTLAAQVGTIAQEEFDLGYSIRHYDVELTLGAGAVDTFHGGTGPSGVKGSVYAEVKKALSTHTFAGVRIEGLFGGAEKANVPVFGIMGGFTF